MLERQSRYQLISEAEEDGIVVSTAWDTKRQIPVSVRHPAAPSEPGIVARFVQVARAVSKWKHPHLLSVIDAGEVDGLPYLVMQSLSGGTLAQRVDSASTSPLGLMRRWLPEIAAAVDYANEKGALLRFLPTDAVCFDGMHKAYLDCSFLACGASGRRVDKARVAPELLGPQPARSSTSDQYALAALALRTLGGQPPRDFLRDAQPQMKCDVPASAVAALRKALTPNPDERFPSALAFAEAAVKDIATDGLDASIARMLCPKCGNPLKVPPTAPQRQGQCPRCKAALSWNSGCSSIWLARETVCQREDQTLSQDESAESSECWDYFSSIEDAPSATQNGVARSPAAAPPHSVKVWLSVPRLPPIGLVWYGLPILAMMLIAAVLLFRKPSQPSKRPPVTLQPVAAPNPIAPPIPRPPVAKKQPPAEVAPESPRPLSDLFVLLKEGQAFTLSEKAIHAIEIVPAGVQAISSQHAQIVGRDLVSNGVAFKIKMSGKWLADGNRTPPWTSRYLASSWHFSDRTLTDAFKTLPRGKLRFALAFEKGKVSHPDGKPIPLSQAWGAVTVNDQAYISRAPYKGWRREDGEYSISRPFDWPQRGTDTFQIGVTISCAVLSKEPDPPQPPEEVLVELVIGPAPGEDDGGGVKIE